MIHVVSSLEVPPPPGPPPKPPPKPPPDDTRTYFSWPLDTSFSNWARDGSGSLPLKPPIVTTGLPLAMMMESELDEVNAATRYFEDP